MDQEEQAFLDDRFRKIEERAKQIWEFVNSQKDIDGRVQALIMITLVEIINISRGE